MKQLVCEMCGSNEVIKDNEYFVCQACGTKYTVETAKKMMNEESVEVTGTIKIDSSTELDNLYTLARRSREMEEMEKIEYYYNQILLKDPNSAEAQFYTMLINKYNEDMSNYNNETYGFVNQFNIVLNLIKKNNDENIQKEILEQIKPGIIFLTENIVSKNNKIIANKKNMIEFDIEKMKDMKYCSYPSFYNKAIYNRINYYTIYLNFANNIEEIFKFEYPEISLILWKIFNERIADITINYLNPIAIENKRKTINQCINLINETTTKIQKYEPNYNPPEINNNNSKYCYIATSIYGSYDCPKVWTLRRFRDYKLSKNILGKIFIKFYYTTSPTLVKYLGNTFIFKKIFKKILDNFISKLQKKGYKSDYYID